MSAPVVNEANEKALLLLQDALNRLPKSAPDIAAYFMERGIVGRRYGIFVCPVANYLKAELPDSGDAMDAMAGPGLCRYHGAITTTPEAVTAFIRGFDGGLWPHLRVSS